MFICVTVSMFEERNVTESHILRSVMGWESSSNFAAGILLLFLADQIIYC